MREMKKLFMGRSKAIEESLKKVNGLKNEVLEQVKKLIEDGDDITLDSAKNATRKLQSVLEDHMLKDPLPPERIELLKCEIKSEVQEEL